MCCAFLGAECVCVCVSGVNTVAPETGPSPGVECPEEASGGVCVCVCVCVCLGTGCVVAADTLCHARPAPVSQCDLSL